MDITMTLGLALSNENFRSVQLSIKGSQKCNFTVDTVQAWLLFKCLAADFQQALSVNEVTILEETMHCCKTIHIFNLIIKAERTYNYLAHWTTEREENKIDQGLRCLVTFPNKKKSSNLYKATLQRGLKMSWSHVLEVLVSNSFLGISLHDSSARVCERDVGSQRREVQWPSDCYTQSTTP